MTRSPLLVTDAWVTDRPETSVVRAALTLTLYLDEPRRWALEHVGQLFDRFSAFIHPSWLRWYWTSQDARWRPLESASDLRAVVVAGQITGRLRHLLEIRLADCQGAPRVGFVYREVDGRPGSPAGYVQVQLPVDMNPEELLAIAIEVSHRFPVLSGVGGYGFTWNPEMPRNAFGLLAKYCRRYLGMDIQPPESTAWHVGNGALPGVSWLTLVGGRFRGEPEALRPPTGARWAEDVRVIRSEHATLLAGAQPHTGDANMMEFPDVLSQVSRWLAPRMMPAPDEFPDTFGEDGARIDWMHRFASPERWA